MIVSHASIFKIQVNCLEEMRAIIIFHFFHFYYYYYIIIIITLLLYYYYYYYIIIIILLWFWMPECAFSFVPMRKMLETTLTLLCRNRIM